ncbi:MAG: LysE family transporter [Bacteroidetes bacterium]|nr:LysE family transporter [Bacteroidota bacterium]MDA0974237.1 LysE family transporter [Bacteroidota bacterium]
MSFITGFAIGLAMLVFIGPVLFTLLNGALTYGFRGGLSISNGIIISDILCVLLCYYGASRFLETEDYSPMLAILGAFLLIGMGLKYIMRHKVEMERIIAGPRKRTSLFVQGFLVNFVNPFVFIVWIGVITYGQEKYGDGMDLFWYLSASLAAVYITDVLKAFYASKLLKLLDAKTLSRINTVLGVLLILFSIRLLWWAWSAI